MNESTHWDGCEAEHPLCLLRAERDEWKVAVERVERDRDAWRQRAEDSLAEIQKISGRWRQLNDSWQKHAELVAVDANQLTDEVDRMRQRTETAESDRDTWRERCMANAERAEQAETELDRLRSLRVRTADDRAVDGITYDGIRQYLSGHGWNLTNPNVLVGRGYESWQLPIEPDGKQRAIPIPKTPIPDQVRHMRDIAQAITEVEQRGVLGVLADLRDASTTAGSPQGGLAHASESPADDQPPEGPQNGAESVDGGERR